MVTSDGTARTPVTSARSHIQARPAEACRYDIAAMGEVMLRLDPGERRIRSTRSFDAWDSGAEYNVARAFRRCFGLRGALVSAFVDNEVGRLLEDIILGSGLDLDFVHWVPFDGIGLAARNGLNFSERGFGVRGALGCVDRANTAISRLRPGDVDWYELFAERGVRLFHTGGIMAGLSDQAAETTRYAIQQARAHGTPVSYDLNYRPSLWRVQGGEAAAQRVNRELVRDVSVLLGNEEDFSTSLGITVEGIDASMTAIDVDAYARLAQAVAEEFPNLDVIGITLRTVHSATSNSWGALAWARGGEIAVSQWRSEMAILDRLGGGDSFASGLLYGLLQGTSLQHAVDLGAANGALAMTTPGDTTTATLAELERMVAGAGTRVQR